MKYQTVTRTIDTLEIVQNAILRSTVDNFSQRKSREQLVDEHKRLDISCDKNKYVVHNINKQENLTLNIQLRISISNLKVDNVPTGRFLLCRVISKFVKLFSLLALVEDPEGNVERLALYNWTNFPKEGQSNIKPIDQLFLPIGTLLVIKNISYEVATSNITIIRSNNPDDVIVVDHNNKLFDDVKWSTNEKKVEIKNANDFRRCGNDYFASSNYITAIDKYSNGIKLEPQNVTLLNNRAEAYLRLYQFHNAFKDTEIALKYDPNNLKAAYRKGKALCGLKHYKDATNILQNLYQRMKGNTSIKQILEHTEMLSYENKNGKYDYLRIVDEFYERSKIKKDNKVDLVEGKGRGWIAKCDIPECTLLMVSKAFKVVFSNEAFGTMITNNKGACSCAEELTTCITRKLFEEPYYCPEVYQLYDGLNLSRDEKNKIIGKSTIHIEFIICALVHNIFGLNYEKFNLNNEITGLGLWILPSFFNHACIDENTYSFHLGDLLFVRTNRPISKGEELVINYRDATFSYEERLSYLEYINVDCQCRMCKLERSESQEIKLRMAQLLKAYHESIYPKVSKSHSVELSHIKELENIIAELRNLRKEHPDLGFNTIKLSKTLAFAYLEIGNNKKALSILKEAYDLYKSVRVSEIRIIIFDIIMINSKLKLFEEAKKWFDIILKIVVEPIMGKLEDDKPEWRKEALLLTEKILPKINSIAETLNIV
ncbi:uncharacterized protein OCT59_023514 [Rhizophagus irregularis]|uniref:Uncharacterized protein n=2 Tax=Rhizophagus irregularis (strain DAOM 181602 / DAOM 197198 / MUCL 43194) TaxID=747089 RepID=A0A2H5RQW3_RHIID|nr:hypothetical protein GLOIN_2v1881383 [Rhizophagus irregularis DAOM 181602=DAOM 197198]POG64371.1 hypothetical protein GLOIN_2v1881383 [Rhizophagus irregularis DAOM 181602=DAOM 197198]UZO03101.1 hypothetical protein OCT59_023514 [Rhizophagus irregularis]GBC20464.1 hypothetical protein RIR_jg39392.t1 [Rhizophagus irregularis DAOM 181602=DAOM 197198]|eukprot:XP_025171237.1 hypothetical protein GLOIN_2v1881383 [Rhizophagus irregularis DAOM 181602=DAOM 197198]